MDHPTPDPARLAPLFAPLHAEPEAADGCFVIARTAQSLDGYIATRAGESCWIGGPDDLAHTHRLRSLCDAVVVGSATVRADDPRLTTRLVPGPSPTRVVLDTDRKLAGHFRVFSDDGPETLLLCAPDAAGSTHHGNARTVAVPRGPAGLDVGAIVATLAERGLRRILIEGGGVTVARFFRAGALDRMHVTIAPVLMGGGVAALPMAPVERLAEAPRFGWTIHRLGNDILADIPLTRRA
jgi:diaminohydroxyphosphoribosylaminopyrimidine deaminase / 5-amino-6-(5-phosphoribosylamino)uracil reductase